MADGIKKLVKKADDVIDLEKHLPKRLLTEEAEAFAKKADKVADDVVEDAAKAIKSGSNTKTLFRGDRASVVPDDVFKMALNRKEHIMMHCYILKVTQPLEILYLLLEI